MSRGLEFVVGSLRQRLARLKHRDCDAVAVDAHSGIAGLLYVLATAERAGVAGLDRALGARAVGALTRAVTVTPALPGLMHGSAGRALAVAAAVQAGWASADDALLAHLDVALAGRLDWPDVTHGAAGQGLAALACAHRLGRPALAAHAKACAAYLVERQKPDGSWTLPTGASVSGQCYTGFAHGAAGMMAFLGQHAAQSADDAGVARAWRRAEDWLIRRARHRPQGRRRWPLTDRGGAAATGWWCHGAPGIALGLICVAQAQGLAAVSEAHLRSALTATMPALRSDSLGQCHGLAGVGEVYLQAHDLLGEPSWRERADDIASVLVALCHRRAAGLWHYPSREPSESADGLMLGTAGIVHFLVRCRHPHAVGNPPLLG